MSILLSAALLTGMGGDALADAQQDAAGTMELPVGSFAELAAQVPDVPLMDAPSGATDVAYSVVGDTPTVAQIKFVLHDRSFCYRAARFDSSANMPDISGMQYAFDAQMELGGVLYRQDTVAGAGVASWYYESTKSQYCVSMQRAFDAGYMRQVVTAMRSQNGANPTGAEAEVYGTVTGAASDRITLKGVDGRSYAFAIGASTKNPNASKLKKNALVRVTYAAPYAEDRLANKIIYLGVAGGASKSSTPQPSSATKSGTILSRGPERLQILRPSGSVYTFYTGEAAVYGDTWAGVGDSATVRYYVSSSGSKIATKITYTAAYCPAPQPWPAPDPYAPYPDPYVPYPDPYAPYPDYLPYPWTGAPDPYAQYPDPRPLLG